MSLFLVHYFILRFIYIGEVCAQKCQWYRDTILASLLALANLGGTTQIGSFIFQSLGQGKQGGQYRVMISLMFSSTNFTNVNELLTHYQQIFLLYEWSSMRDSKNDCFMSSTMAWGAFLHTLKVVMRLCNKNFYTCS
jgi:hypothetical protein